MITVSVRMQGGCLVDCRASEKIEFHFVDMDELDENIPTQEREELESNLREHETLSEAIL